MGLQVVLVEEVRKVLRFDETARMVPKAKEDFPRVHNRLEYLSRGHLSKNFAVEKW